ncbi:MAG: PEP-CTERM sorting domain-containing protein [Vicinamibacterales bacterium]
MIFDRMLTGQGSVSVTASFLSNPNPGPALFSVDGVRYDFSPADPVPEPATLLLFGTGLAAAVRWRRRPLQ